LSLCGLTVERRLDNSALFAGIYSSLNRKQLEIARLKREVIKLKAERDILKKAAAYFAKEST
jgi:transposase